MYIKGFEGIRKGVFAGVSQARRAELESVAGLSLRKNRVPERVKSWITSRGVCKVLNLRNSLSRRKQHRR